MFKKNVKIKTSLLKLPVSLRIYLNKFRVSNHKSPIERGRYGNLERSERKCNVCRVLGDEFHFFCFSAVFLITRGSYFSQNIIGPICSPSYISIIL